MSVKMRYDIGSIIGRKLPFWVMAVVRIRYDGLLISLIPSLKKKTVHDLAIVCPALTSQLLYEQDSYGYSFDERPDFFVRYSYLGGDLTRDIILIQKMFKDCGGELEYKGLFNIPRPVLSETQKSRLYNLYPFGEVFYPTKEVIDSYTSRDIELMKEYNEGLIRMEKMVNDFFYPPVYYKTILGYGI